MTALSHMAEVEVISVPAGSACELAPPPVPALAALADSGCPACRYARRVRAAYFAWAGGEGHASPDFLGPIRASRGMCDGHTRRLFAHPGTTSAVAGVYRHVVAAVAEDPCADRAGCAVCAAEATAEYGFLSTLLEELATADRRPYKRHGGLCLPHLRRAARLSRNRDVRWLIRFAIARLAGPAPELELLAGLHDAGADCLVSASRAAPGEARTARTCQVCVSVADAEQDELASVSSVGGGTGTASECLCPRHLREAVAARGNLATSLLTWQAHCHRQCLARALNGQPRLLGISAGWMSPRARSALADPDCPVCRGARAAAVAQAAQIRSLLQEGGHACHNGLRLCVRHGAQLHAPAPAASDMASRLLRQDARKLLAELSAAIGTDDLLSLSAACWRAASFLDGSVLTGRKAFSGAALHAGAN